MNWNESCGTCGVVTTCELQLQQNGPQPPHTAHTYVAYRNDLVLTFQSPPPLQSLQPVPDQDEGTGEDTNSNISCHLEGSSLNQVSAQMTHVAMWPMSGFLGNNEIV